MKIVFESKTALLLATCADTLFGRFILPMARPKGAITPFIFTSAAGSSPC